MTGGEGGCAPQLQIQVASICDRNALVLDVRPKDEFTTRGVRVWEYDEGRLEFDAGASHVTVAARQGLAARAIAGLRPVSATPGRPGGGLPEPRYPRAFLAELRRVQDMHRRTRSVRATRNRLGISQAAVRFRLHLSQALDATSTRNPPC